MSLTRVIALGNEGTLRITPAEELKAGRLMKTTNEDMELRPSRERTPKARGRSIELNLEISGAETSPLYQGLRLA